MRRWGCQTCVASLIAAIWAIGIEAVDFKRFDGIHRVEKRAQITKAASLERRDEPVCGESSKLCASSFDGGCCPDNYECAKESCYATTKGPSTCGTKVGWFVCDAVYGGESISRLMKLVIFNLRQHVTNITQAAAALTVIFAKEATTAFLQPAQPSHTTVLQVTTYALHH